MTFARFAIALLAAVVLVACGGSSPTSPTSAGTTTVMLRDTPFSDARAVLVTFSEVSVRRGDGSFVSLPLAGGSATLTCDLERLASAQHILGTGPLEPGHYTQLRLTVSAARLNFSNSTSGATCAAAMAPPAGVSLAVEVSPSILILNGEFDVTNSQTTTITLDFDASRSIVQTGDGTYRMRPLIAVAGVQ